jgi:hypothetical protein
MPLYRLITKSINSFWSYLDSQIPGFDANSLPGIKPFI